MTAEPSTEIVELITDGGCAPNPGDGAWACLLRFRGVEKALSGFVADTTNNRMELLAALKGLQALKRGVKVKLITDSQYLKNGIETWSKSWVANGWRTSDKKPVANAEIWQALLEEAKRHQIQFQWVRGHSGHPDNERVDQLVTETRLGRGKLDSASID